MPYKKLERPTETKSKVLHVRRYFTALVEKILAILIPISVFLVPVTYSRVFIWLALSGLIVLLLLTLVIVLRQKIEMRFSGLLALLFVLGVVVVGAFATSNTSLSLGITSLTSQVTMPVFVLGVLWIGIILFFRSETRFLKSIVISHFLGSTLLTLYILYIAFFNGGYSALTWVTSGSWLLVFVATIFAMLSFAMLQKKAAKIIWTISIILHLVVLFIWDTHFFWILLLFGISALLVYQIIYSKKLWQKNFVYPLQIWIIVFLLLVIPVKTFSGTNIPQEQAIPYSSVQQIFKDKDTTQKVLGTGAGTASFEISRSSISFVNVDEINKRYITEMLVIKPAIGQIILELGWLGSFVLLLVLIIFIVKGILFLRKHRSSLKEINTPRHPEAEYSRPQDDGVGHSHRSDSTISEAVYLGTITYLSALLVIIGLFFSGWGFASFWILLLLLGLSLGFWQTAEQTEADASKLVKTYSFAKSGILQRMAQIIVAILGIGYIVVLIFGIRVIGAEKAVANALQETNILEQARQWDKAASRNPWNQRYATQSAGMEIRRISEGSSFDEQKMVLGEVVKKLQNFSVSSQDPIVHWLSALAYIDLEQFAEGSAQLARESYLRAIELWPKNTALASALSEFYRDYLDSLVSGEVSAQNLRLEVMDHLRAALALEPEYLPARLELGLVLEEEEDLDAALAELEPWEDVNPQFKYHVARLYFNKSEFATAAEKFGSVVKSVPNHSNARYSLGISYFRLEQYDNSLVEFEEVLRLNPGSEDVEAKIRQVREKMGEGE